MKYGAISLSIASSILKEDYCPVIRMQLNGDVAGVEAWVAEQAERRYRERLAEHGEGPLLSECMPAELDPCNTWWWLPEDWDRVDEDFYDRYDD